MDPQHIEGMIRALKPVLMNRQKARTILERYWQERMALVWTVEHIHRAANERGMALTKAEACLILENLHQKHNRQYGLRWSDLTQIIEDGGLGRPLTKRELQQFVEKDRLTIQR
jgi:hypothetical protein